MILDGNGLDLSHLEDVPAEARERLMYVIQHMEDQAHFVSDSNRLMARAWAYRKQRSRAYVIYESETPIGMALYYDCDALQAYDFSQSFIDERYQGQGYGIEAARQIIGKMCVEHKYDKVCLCYIEGNTAAMSMYEKLGFQRTGETDGDEIVMAKELRSI